MSEIEWRRCWKPDLLSRPWIKMTLADGCTYLVKYLFRDRCYEVLLTDLTSSWLETISDCEIINRSKTLNPSVDAPIGRLLSQIEAGLTDEDVKQRSVASEDDDEVAVLTVESQLAGFPFIWKFRATKTDQSIMVNHMTIPLLSMVSELTRRQNELYKLLTDKDREINDYRLQGVKPTRKNVKTCEFDCTVFDSKMLASKEFEDEVAALGANTFQTEHGRKLYSQIMTKYSYLTSNNTTGTATGGVGGEEDGSLFGEITDDIPETSGGPSWGNTRLPASLVNKPSPNTSPAKSPQKSAATIDHEQSQSTAAELLRRQELDRKLILAEAKKEEKAKKKRKLKL
ncbi:non-homologous end-joining factor 1-like [Tubulanus polymorphus]|uniref:non-homologous end-joining factor 1-like n=1 Tax=Tubulanus polymorphus TaxID=672921 RepID=UPI003DA63A76